MTELSKSQEITDLNFDGENPHIAICHKSQGYSANNRHNALLFKSNQPLSQEVLKSLDGIVEESVIMKMSFKNKIRLLEDKLEEYIKNKSMQEDVWVWVQDFNESVVVFEHRNVSYAMDYSESNEVITLQGDAVEVVRKDLYIDSETGEELVKAVSHLSKSIPLEEENTSESGESEGETYDTPEQQEEIDEDNMSDNKPEVSTDELLKSAAVQELLKQAVTDAVEAKEKELEKKALVASTTDVIKGFSFVAEDSVEALVKSVIADDNGASIVKALTDAQDKIESLQNEITKTKEEFGKPQSVQDEVTDKQNHASDDRTSELQKAVAAAKAKQSK